MPRRFRLRTVLILIAVLAVTLKGEMTRRRWASFRQQAALHAQMEATSTRTAQKLGVELASRERSYLNLKWRCGNELRMLNALRAVSVHEAQQAAYHRRLREEYSRRW